MAARSRWRHSGEIGADPPLPGRDAGAPTGGDGTAGPGLPPRGWRPALSILISRVGFPGPDGTIGPPRDTGHDGSLRPCSSHT